MPPAQNSSDWLLLCRTVRFGDTDAAGVMHFHQLLLVSRGLRRKPGALWPACR